MTEREHNEPQVAAQHTDSPTPEDVADTTSSDPGHIDDSVPAPEAPDEAHDSQGTVEQPGEHEDTSPQESDDHADTYGAVSLEDIVGTYIDAQSDDTHEVHEQDGADDTPEASRMPQDGFGDTEGSGVPSVESLPAEDRSADYFADDEEYLEDMNDQVVYEAQDLGMYQQEEGTVSWELLNFRNDAGRQRNRFVLKNDPPILRIDSSDGQTAEFVLTQRFAKGLSEELDSVYKAYFGIEAKQDKKNTKEKFSSFREWIQEHPVLSWAIGIVIVLILIATLI